MTQPPLATLADELLEAHLDTLELARELSSRPDWDAHFEYLRALQRRGRELLAAAGAELTGR
ncbi:MAG TPA: hypothetical protein VGY32_12050 [Solirubrobacteraceae bacterium]|jgi:hypothetical protein|nr:hypothetical protein [Solirubrobacteraceae bacterium]